MKSLLMTTLATSMLLIGCQSEIKTETETLANKDIVAPAVILQNPEVPLSEVAESSLVNDEELFEFDEDGILLCEEDEYGICLDEVKHNIRAEQLRERHYAHDTAIAEALPDAVEVVEYEEQEVVGYLRNDAPADVDPATLPPLRVWGSDLANHMTKYPRETEAKFGQRKLIISGQIGQVYTNGVELGRTFVEVPTYDLQKNDTITVYCHGVYAGGSWGISAIGVNCSR